MSGDELQALFAAGHAQVPHREVFNALFDLGRGGPAGFSRDELAERLGWDAGGSHLRNRLSELSAMEIVAYPARGQVVLQRWVP
jgi:hypothetical protein